MTGLALLLLTAALGHGLARWWRLPTIPLLLGLGMALSFSGLAPRGGTERADLVITAVELGITFLVFASGIELDPGRFRQHRRAVWWIGSVQFFVAGALGYILARLLGNPTLVAIYLALAVSASSTLIGLQQLRRTRQVFEPFGRTVLGVLLLQDVLMIVAIVTLARSDGGLLSALGGLLATTGLAFLAIGLQRHVAKPLVLRGRIDEETLLIGGLAVLFLFASLARLLGLPLVAGAFFAGFALSGFPVSGMLRGLLPSLTDFFQALFFTALGALVVVPDGSSLLRALILAFLVVLLTPPLVTVIAERTGFSSRPSIESGLLLAQTSEYSLVLGLTGLYLGHLTEEQFSIIALMAVSTMTLTPFLATERVTGWLLHIHPLRQRLDPHGAPRDHVLLLGFGSAGMWVVKPLLASGAEILVVDDDPVVIEHLQRMRIPCLRGDGSEDRVLARAGANQARLIIASMRRANEAAEVLRRVRGVPVVVRVFEEEDAALIRRLGGIPVLNSQASADTFMEWFNQIGPRRGPRVDARSSADTARPGAQARS
jgi:Kef-type K+ transport system membrane component KefB